ncbi:MAG: HAMP domain-containing sensor histidine kinase [Candidatus Sulfotelmatobacter sp.]
MPAKNRWFHRAGAVTFVFAGLSVALPHGRAQGAISDFTYLFLLLTIGITMLFNAWATQGVQQRFWVLMGSGYLLWASNALSWTYYDIVLRKAMPDPWFMDMFLFLHLIPIIAAIGLRPHRAEGEHKFRVGTLDFLLLLIWWVFLYAFVVFPAQYVNLDSVAYERNFGSLYLVQSGVFVCFLGAVARGATDGWKKFYLNLMAASAFYAVASEAIDLALARGTYYSGSLYDVPLVGAVSWMAATALSARKWNMDAVPVPARDRWSAISARFSMLAILSLPLLGLRSFLWDSAPAETKTFRLFTVLVAMLVLGSFMFLRQYLQDQTLIRLLDESQRSFENEQRLQSHLVQREKLASLGQLVAGAAHEIDHPLNEIMEFSEKLWSNERLTGEQDTLVRKIVHHSQRTRDLVSSLLSFAQQSSGEKKMVDVCTLLQRSVQMKELQRRDQKIRIETLVEPNLPKVWGDGHQLFHAFVQITENGLDALEETGGGWLRVSARSEGLEVVVQFSDNGPGIKEPHRVFDPFYTTKPIGKGTGLGLSAVYGVIQDHRGQITCHNNPEGGASFTLRLPTVSEPAAQWLTAAAKS